MRRHTLVVARYKESIAWLGRVPELFEVVVYNKGDRLGPVRRSGVSAVQLENAGREAGTYLHHIRDYRHGSPDGYTIFCQGDPFEHSPDFLGLLYRTRQWRPVQPLSLRFKDEPPIPPRELIRSDRRDHVGDLKVRLETYSLYSLEPIHFHDPGVSGFVDKYRRQHGLAQDTNLAQHFFQGCGLSDIAYAAGRHHLGQMAYGAIFAVKTGLLSALRPDTIERLIAESREPAGPYMLERFWLHVFGLPFLLPDGAAAPG